MKEKTEICLFAIGAITVLESIALAKGINGALLTSAFTMIGAIAGYLFKSVNEAKKSLKK